jgi:mannose-6-phosphate isomerase-like protein (cupin superfamily)
VPWHNQEQEEVYFIVEGTGEMCLGEERQTVSSGQMIYIPRRFPTSSPIPVKRRSA